MNFLDLLTHKLFHRSSPKVALSSFIGVTTDVERDLNPIDEIHVFSCRFNCMQKLKGPVTSEVIKHAKQEAALTFNHLVFGEIKSDLLALREKLYRCGNLDAAEEISMILANHCGA